MSEQCCGTCKWYHKAAHTDEVQGLCEIPKNVIKIPIWFQWAIDDRNDNRKVYSTFKDCPTHEAKPKEPQ